MKERIKKLRKKLDMTQQKFADRLGVKRNTVGQWECGINALTDQVILSICREFSVNEEWLRTGNGEMFVPKSDNILDAIAAEYNLDHSTRMLIEKFLKLSPEQQESVISYSKKIAALLADIPDDSDGSSYLNAPSAITVPEKMYGKSLDIAQGADFSASSTTDEN